jgi:flagellar motility protein MotE (MotC chaperone)
MISPQNIRILPVLLIVALLAFSVRLVDFATGVKNLSGAAQAMEKEEPSPVSDAAGQEPPDPSELAKEGEQAKPATEKEVTEKAASEKSSADSKEPASEATAAPEWRDASDEEVSTQTTKMEVLKDLSARREGLDKKEQELQTREALLRAAEQEIDRKYQELSGLRSQLENLLDKQSEEEKSRITSLVKVYEGMKPKEAARIFDTLDIPVLMSVMSKMSERKLSPIMASMNPERAKTMTIMLAEEKTLPTLPP